MTSSSSKNDVTKFYLSVWLLLLHGLRCLTHKSAIGKSRSFAPQLTAGRPRPLKLGVPGLSIISSVFFRNDLMSGAPVREKRQLLFFNVLSTVVNS